VTQPGDPVPAGSAVESSLDISSGPGTQDGSDDSGVDPSATPGIADDVSTVLSGLPDLPVEEHPAVYEAVHRRLGDTLSGIDHV